MITRFRRFLRQLRPTAITRIILGDLSRQRGYGLPLLSPDFQCLVVHPDSDDFGVIDGGTEYGSDPSRRRQYPFRAHRDVPYEGLAQ